MLFAEYDKVNIPSHFRMRANTVRTVRFLFEKMVNFRFMGLL